MTKKYLPDINKLNDKSLLGILIHLKCSQVQVAPEKKKEHGTRDKYHITNRQRNMFYHSIQLQALNIINTPS